MKNFVWSFTTPDHETFPIPLKYVDVMRQTQTSINNVSIDLWTEAKGVTLSEEWTGTTGFQILRTRLLAGNKWVDGRLAKMQNTTRPDSLWDIFQETKWKRDCIMGRRRSRTASSTPQQRNLRGIDRWQRSLQGGCWCSPETGKGYCSCFAVHCEDRQSRETSGSCNFSWCQWGAVRFRK